MAVAVVVVVAAVLAGFDRQQPSTEKLSRLAVKHCIGYHLLVSKNMLQLNSNQQQHCYDTLAINMSETSSGDVS